MPVTGGKMNKSHSKYITIDDKITAHLREPKNKVICEFFAKQEGYKSLSQWIENIIENEIIPNRFNGGNKQ